jgi:integrase
MATKRKIAPKFHAQRDRWMLDIPATMSDTDKRIKMFFKTRDEARKHLEEITGEMPSAAIPPLLAMEADKARAILEPWNLDLVQAAREVAAALEALGDAGSILEAAKAYRLTHNARTASKPLGVAVALYLDSKTDLRDATLKSYKYTLEKALAPLADSMMADIETSDLEAILAPKAATARAMHKRNLRVFWKWASIAPRQWAEMATVDALEAIRISSDADIEILKPAEVKALLHAAEAEGTGAAAAYAIAIFGGVRMAELGKLTWGDIGEDNIEIGKAIAKKHSRRLIPVCPTLRAWMDATRGDAKDTAPIVPANWTDVSKSVRRRAGWNVAARLLQQQVDAGTLAALPKTPKGKWPANACRHTCASVQVAIGTPLDDLTFKFGHSGGHDLLRRHYVSRLTKKDALAILAIGPNSSKISNLKIA